MEFEEIKTYVSYGRERWTLESERPGLKFQLDQLQAV